MHATAKDNPLSDNGITDERITESLRLVGHICNLLRVPRSRREDAMQVGAMALCRARQTYDPSKAEWSTYAYRLVWLYVVNAGFRDRYVVRRKSNGKVSSLHRAKQSFIAEHGREPTHNELAERANVPVADVADIYRSTRILSLNSPLRGKDRGQTRTVSMIDLLPAKPTYESSAMEERIAGLMRRLPSPHYEVMHARYYQRKTGAQVARLFGVTRQRVGQIERKSIESLGRWLAELCPKDFAEEMEIRGVHCVA